MEKEGLESVVQAENILSVFSQTNPQLVCLQLHFSLALFVLSLED